MLAGMSRGSGEGRGGRAAPPRGRARARDRSGEEILDSLGELFAHMRTHFERVVQPFDLPGPCAKALRLIDGSISMKELGARIHCDASFITAIADTLEERGLALREIDPDDRRIKRLVLTPKGTELRARLAHELFNDVPGIRHLDAPERESLLQLLHKMVARETGGAE
jgi:MarR family transcriptional regulator, organic hydroperoxide resistance regulator